MAKRTTISDNKFLNSVNIGLILKAQREHLNLSQKDVADRLGYRNYNYISMLERGASTISIPKIPSIIDAYELPVEFSIVIAKGLYPEFYEAMFYMVKAISGKDIQTVDSEANQLMATMVKEFRIKLQEAASPEKTFSMPRSS